MIIDLTKSCDITIARALEAGKCVHVLPHCHDRESTSLWSSGKHTVYGKFFEEVPWDQHLQRMEGSRKSRTVTVMQSQKDLALKLRRPPQDGTAFILGARP